MTPEHSERQNIGINGTNFQNAWIPLNNDPEILVALHSPTQIIIHDGYYNQYMIFDINELLAMTDNDRVVKFGFNGTLRYTFDNALIYRIKQCLAFTQMYMEDS